MKIKKKMFFHEIDKCENLFARIGISMILYIKIYTVGKKEIYQIFVE